MYILARVALLKQESLSSFTDKGLAHYRRVIKIALDRLGLWHHDAIDLEHNSLATLKFRQQVLVGHEKNRFDL